MKTPICKMKNTQGMIDDRLDIAKENISELEETAI